jgi:outer membrane protein TolC
VTGLTAAQAEQIVVAHADRFLGWVATAAAAQPIAARLRGSFNLRDDKLRQFYYRGQVGKQVAALGPDLGMTVAAVNTGPTAEAYVGGGS